MQQKQSWLQSILIYKDERMLKILLLGSISGFPWVLIATSLSICFGLEDLVDQLLVGAGLIFGVYAFNYLWAINDRQNSVTYFNKSWSQKKLIVLMQVIILVGLIEFNNSFSKLSFINFCWINHCSSFSNTRHNFRCSSY